MKKFLFISLFVIACGDDEAGVSTQELGDGGSIIFSTDVHQADVGTEDVESLPDAVTSDAEVGQQDNGVPEVATDAKLEDGGVNSEDAIQKADSEDISEDVSEDVPGDDTEEDVQEPGDIEEPSEDASSTTDEGGEESDVSEADVFEDASEDVFAGDIPEEDVQTEPMLATVTITFSNETKIAYQQGTNFHYPKTYLPGEWTLTIDQKTKIWVYGSDMEIFSDEVFHFWTDNTKGPFGWADGPPQGEETSLLLNFEITQWVNILLE